MLSRSTAAAAVALAALATGARADILNDAPSAETVALANDYCGIAERTGAEDPETLEKRYDESGVGHVRNVLVGRFRSLKSLAGAEAKFDLGFPQKDKDWLQNGVALNGEGQPRSAADRQRLKSISAQVAERLGKGFYVGCPTADPARDEKRLIDGRRAAKSRDAMFDFDSTVKRIETAQSGDICTDRRYPALQMRVADSIQFQPPRWDETNPGAAVEPLASQMGWVQRVCVQAPYKDNYGHSEEWKPESCVDIGLADGVIIRDSSNWLKGKNWPEARDEYYASKPFLSDSREEFVKRMTLRPCVSVKIAQMRQDVSYRGELVKFLQDVAVGIGVSRSDEDGDSSAVAAPK
jgi:hypothetical protein